jgi:hypothetical protein
MSRLTYRAQDVVVYDDVLSAADFARLFAYLNEVEYSSVHARTWRKVWRLHDGNPLTGKAHWYYPDAAPDGTDARFPTGAPIDKLIHNIVEYLPDVEAVIGRPQEAWDRFSFAGWVYPSGSGLSLHHDGYLYSGAFTYFAHPEWRIHWGGHLVVLDPSTKGVDPENSDMCPPFLSDEIEAVRVLDPGLGLTILAKPNRLVFISPMAEHMMTRVDVNAGQNARVSVAGFFHRPSG